ncbi:MAG: UDP-N-acetylmuramoyl-L-alanyl-D-glutamate--2,6-diaminopimelate ligase [Coriobacteriia bacterium]
MDTKSLSHLLEGMAAQGDARAAQGISGVAYRSDLTRPGDVFFCIPGFQRDGHEFAADAVAHGAVAVVCERTVEVAVPQIIVPDARRALAVAASRFFGQPSRRLSIAGVTGTNGKTTTTYLIDSVLRCTGRTTGLIGTVETRIGDVRQPSARTTPESADLQALLAKMVREGVDAVSMEVSSHAIDLHRVDAVEFAVAAFTNLTQDHLDYHHTLAEYWSVKRRLFTELEVAERVVNIDDSYGAGLAAALGDVWTVGRAKTAAVRAVDERPGADSTVFTLVTPHGSAELVLPLAGAYNVSNALVAAGCGLALGLGLEAVVDGLNHAPQVPGRLERIDEGQQFTVLVDYAHTPDSLGKAIAAVRAVTPGRVITVFGCGGDRDPEKRPLMGRAAGEAADVVVVTSDNPRSEDPVGIILAIEDGLRGTAAVHTAEVDRRSAIGSALAMARPGDAVLIAGKGHEDYQIFADRTIHFDDREVAREELRSLC